MRKFFRNILVIMIVITVFAGCCCPNSTSSYDLNGYDTSKSPSDYNTGATLEEALKEKKPVVVKFYTDWCGACRRAAPVFDAMRTEFSDKASFVMINAEQNSDLAGQYGVRYFPTLYIVNPVTSVKEQIPNDFVYDEESFRDYLNGNLPKFKPVKQVRLY